MQRGRRAIDDSTGPGLTATDIDLLRGPGPAGDPLFKLLSVFRDLTIAEQFAINRSF